MERSEQQNPERRCRQDLSRAAGRAAVPERGGEEEAAGGDPEQRQGLRELLLLREASTAMFPPSSQMACAGILGLRMEVEMGLGSVPLSI